MDIVTDKNYCRRCRKKHNYDGSPRTNYCLNCRNKIRLDEKSFDRWYSSDVFIETSFVDCISSVNWSGFKKIKYNRKLIQVITDKFPEVQHIVTTTQILNLKYIPNGNYLYLLSDQNKTLLKVGQTQNLTSRFRHYYNSSDALPICYDVFAVDSFEKQDLYEDKIRNLLEYLGYLLPLDNTGFRLKYII
jgi:hypothetical protein